MKPSIIVLDDFCPTIGDVRNSALQSGFGTWRPNKGEVGSSVYDGMSFWGLHSHLLRSLNAAVGRPVLPNNMFFRITTPETEKAYVHSDRAWGSHTCIVYLSEHTEVSGTGFYRHRKTGMLEMPTLETMKGKFEFDELKRDMVHGGEDEWEQTDFVRGLLNRALIFDAPLFHARMPKHGIGGTEETSRMVWVCHFVT
jgi:hypothetical protein